MAKQRASKSAAGASDQRTKTEKKRRARYDRLESFDRRYGDRVAGVDEAGRGALAGPVVSAAVVLPPGSGLTRIFDSKQLTETEREEIFEEVVANAVAVGISFGQPPVIDRDNILCATLMTMHRAVDVLGIEPDVVLIDGRDSIQRTGHIVPVTRGDSSSLAIAAASIVAKVARDRSMRRLHKLYPHYNFIENKGYGTRDHLEAIVAHGCADVHRQTFLGKLVENNPSMF